MSDVRKYTNAVIELMDNEMLSSKVIAETCLGFMSEADVKEMLECNDLMPFIRAMDAVRD